MARKLRVEYEGAIYHVMNRGDRREPIFRGESDRVLFLLTLGEACAKTDWQVHAYWYRGSEPNIMAKKGRKPLSLRPSGSWEKN